MRLVLMHHGEMKAFAKELYGEHVEFFHCHCTAFQVKSSRRNKGNHSKHIISSRSNFSLCHTCFLRAHRTTHCRRIFKGLFYPYSINPEIPFCCCTTASDSLRFVSSQTFHVYYFYRHLNWMSRNIFAFPVRHRGVSSDHPPTDTYGQTSEREKLNRFLTSGKSQGWKHCKQPSGRGISIQNPPPFRLFSVRSF